VAVRCLCDLLVTHPHFNYRSNIVAVIVPFIVKRDAQVCYLFFNVIITLMPRCNIYCSNVLITRDVQVCFTFSVKANAKTRSYLTWYSKQ